MGLQKYNGNANSRTKNCTRDKIKQPVQEKMKDKKVPTGKYKEEANNKRGNNIEALDQLQPAKMCWLQCCQNGEENSSDGFMLLPTTATIIQALLFNFTLGNELNIALRLSLL